MAGHKEKKPTRRIADIFTYKDETKEIQGSKEREEQASGQQNEHNRIGKCSPKK